MAVQADVSTKTVLLTLAEEIRFSDPVSHCALADIEAQITSTFAVLSNAATAKNIENVKTAAEELTALLHERNQKCKLLK